MPDSRSLPRGTVAATLRFLAGGWLTDHSDDRKWLVETADRIESTEPADWIACPLCEEVTCDEGCPLAPVRGGDTTP